MYIHMYIRFVLINTNQRKPLCVGHCTHTADCCSPRAFPYTYIHTYIT